VVKVGANASNISSNIENFSCWMKCLDAWKIQKEETNVLDDVGWSLIVVKHFIKHFRQDQRKLPSCARYFSCCMQLRQFSSNISKFSLRRMQKGTKKERRVPPGLSLEELSHLFCLEWIWNQRHPSWTFL